MRERVREVKTSFGPARVTYTSPPKAKAVLFLGHGAGGGVDTPDLVRVAAVCAEAGIEVGRVEQPYRVAGKSLATDRTKLDLAFIEIVEAERLPDHPLFVGGRSAGARVACRTAEKLDATAIVALSFPLHPPKEPGRSRLNELVFAGRPTLVLQGTRDEFGTPEEYPPTTLIHRVEGGDHSFRLLRSSRRTASDLIDELASVARDFVLSFVRTNGR